MIVLCNCELPDDGPVKPDTCIGTDVLKHYCNSNEVCAYVGLQYNNLIIMHGMENVRYSKFFRAKDQGTITVLCRTVQTF
jgi:hypothetical protein